MGVSAFYELVIHFSHFFPIENLGDLTIIGPLGFLFVVKVRLLVIQNQKMGVFELTIPEDYLMENLLWSQEVLDVLWDIDHVNDSLELNLPQEVFQPVARAFPKILWVLFPLVNQGAPDIPNSEVAFVRVHLAIESNRWLETDVLLIKILLILTVLVWVNCLDFVVLELFFCEFLGAFPVVFFPIFTAA